MNRYRTIFVTDIKEKAFTGSYSICKISVLQKVTSNSLVIQKLKVTGYFDYAISYTKMKYFNINKKGLEFYFSDPTFEQCLLICLSIILVEVEQLLY